jgi:hypothetical protein
VGGLVAGVNERDWWIEELFGEAIEMGALVWDLEVMAAKAPPPELIGGGDARSRFGGEEANAAGYAGYSSLRRREGRSTPGIASPPRG